MVLLHVLAEISCNNMVFNSLEQIYNEQNIYLLQKTYRVTAVIDIIC